MSNSFWKYPSTGSVSGTVNDPNGAVVAGVNVKVTLEVGRMTEPVTVTRNRAQPASVNGHRKGPSNITLDGIDVHDNLLKSTDTISEVSGTTTTAGADPVSGGGVQIKFTLGRTVRLLDC